MTTRTSTLVLLAAAAAAALPAAAQQVTFDLGAGYQWLDVTGNADVFRSQAGEKQGLFLDSLSLLITDDDGTQLFDRLLLEAAGVGESADSRVRLEVARARAFNLRLSYDRAEVFSALPGIANPFAAAGVAPGQHTMDRQRDVLDLDLELLPGRALTPTVGFTRATYAGPSRTTYHVGNDEFQLDSDLEETVDELRVGLAFDLGGFRGAVTQGWRETDSTDTLTLRTSLGAGNGSKPTLGNDIYAASIARRLDVSSEAPFTNAYLTGALGSRVRVVGSFARTDSESEASEFDSVAGQFVSFELRRFFLGVEDEASGRADSPAWRGNLRIEAALLDWLDLTAGYTSSHRELDGRSFVTSSYFDTSNYSGVDLGDLTTVLEARTAWERDEDIAELRLVARPTPWLRIWGAAANAAQDVTITPAAAEIVIPGGQGGSFTREIDRTVAGAAVTTKAATLSAEWASDEADDAVVRTDFIERERVRLRGTLRLASWLRVAAVGESTDASNTTPGIDYDAEINRWGGEVEVMPLKWLSLRGGYNVYEADSTLTVRRPHDFVFEPSWYAEDAEDIDATVVVDLGRVDLQLGGSRYSNEGSTPFDLDRTFLRFDFGISDTVGLYGHYEQREYEETTLLSANYEADRYGVFIRWHSK